MRCQFHFCAVNLSRNIDELLVFVELAQLQKLCIDYEVLKRALDVWRARIVSFHEAIEDEYGEYLYEAKTAKIAKLTGQDLEEIARITRDSAAGLDQWVPGDFALTSR